MIRISKFNFDFIARTRLIKVFTIEGARLELCVDSSEISIAVLDWLFGMLWSEKKLVTDENIRNYVALVCLNLIEVNLPGKDFSCFLVDFSNF